MAVRPSTFQPKLPNETELRGIDWSTAIPSGDTITHSTWTVCAPPNDTTPVTLSNQRISGLITLTNVSSGRPNTVYMLVNTITTSSGLVLQEGVPMRVSGTS